MKTVKSKTTCEVHGRQFEDKAKVEANSYRWQAVTARNSTGAIDRRPNLCQESWGLFFR